MDEIAGAFFVVFVVCCVFFIGYAVGATAVVDDCRHYQQSFTFSHQLTCIVIEDLKP